MRRIGFVLIAWSVVIAGAAPTRAAPTTAAVVTGADLLYVRRGPSTSFPALATLERGERVDVERLEGVWAVVRLASGQRGYVHSTFLSFPGAPRPTLFVAPTPTPTATQIPAAPTPSATWAEVTSKPDPSTSSLKTAGKSPEPGAGNADADLQALRAEIQRLTAAVDALQKSVAASPYSPSDSGGGEHSWRSPALGLVILIALVIGWMAGGAYGRQTERSRRNRIRF